MLALLLAGSLVPLAGLGLLEYRALAQAEAGQARAQFQGEALAAALRADAAAGDTRDVLRAAAEGADADEVVLVGADGSQRSTRDAPWTGLREMAGDTLAGVGEIDGCSVAWARAPAADAVVFLVKDAAAPAPPAVPFLLLAAFVATGVILVLAFVMLRVLRPVASLKVASRRLARGAWSERVPVRGPAEVRALAEAFNAMATTLEGQRRELDALLDARTRALLDRESDLDALRFTLAHEFREPVRSLRWMADDLLERPLRPAEREAVILLRRRIDGIDAVFRDMLRYEEVSRRPAPLETTSLDAVLDRALADASLAGALDVDAEPLPAVRGNGDLLVAAFAEILRNAAQHARSPSGRARVRVRGHAAGDAFEVRVDDEGPGIPAARREDALHLFQRLRREGAGTGVGLALARRALERHGGALRLEEAPGGGTRVVMRLPHEPPEEAPPELARQGRRF